MDDEFDVSGDEGAAGDESRINSGGSDGALDEEGVNGPAGVDSLFCCVSVEGVLLGSVEATFIVFCDGFFGFFAFNAGTEPCNCRIVSLGSIGVDRTREYTTQ